MLRFWFGPTLNDAIDANPVGFYLAHGDNFAVADDLKGNPHIVRFSSSCFPTRAVIALPAVQLANEDTYERTVRTQLIWAVEQGVELIVFEQKTMKAYQLFALQFQPGIPASDEYGGGTADLPTELQALVVANGDFTDFGAVGSVNWRERD